VKKILKRDHFNESYWAALSCSAVFVLYKVVLTFEPVDEILKCDYYISNESYWAVLFYGAVYYVVQGGSIFWACGWNTSVTIQMKVTEQYFPVVLFIMLYKVVLCFWVCGGNP